MRIRTIVSRMDTKASPLVDPYNSAVADVFRMRKAEKRLTFPALEAKTGIGVQTLKRLLNDHTSIHMGNFWLLCVALEISPADVATRAQAQMSKASA